MHVTDPQPWFKRLDIDLVHRLGPAPDEVISYLQLAIDQDSERPPPRPATADVGFELDVCEALMGMPSSVRECVAASLMGIFFARGIGSSAIMDVVLWQGQCLGSVFILNLDRLLETDANAWATMREREPFLAASEAPELNVSIQFGRGNTRCGALQFLLLHEIAHVLTAAERWLPAWWLPPDSLGPTDAYPFLKMSWHIDNGGFKLVSPGLARLHEEIVFYGQPRVPSERVHQFYEGLQATDLATLYATRNPYDDFAEAFALYVHTKLLGEHYHVFLSGSQATSLMDGASVEGRCRHKFDFIESLLGRE